MPNIFTGTVGPDVHTTDTTTTTAPGYYTDYLTGLTKVGQEQLGKSGADLVAGMSPLTQAGISGVSGAASAYLPGLTAAQQTAGTVAGGLTPEKIQAMMNPFQTNVVNEMARLSQQNLQRNLMPALKGAFTSTGGMGSQRMMGALGQMGTDVQANLTGLQAKEMETGYQNAVTNALKNLEQQRLGATTEADLASKAQELGLSGTNAMIKAGALEQAQKQAELDAPMKRAADVSALLKNYQIPLSTTKNYTGPMAGVYGTSPLAQLTGLGTLIAALNTAGAGSSGITPWQRIFGGGDSGYSGFNIMDPSTWSRIGTIGTDNSGGVLYDEFGNETGLTDR